MLQGGSRQPRVVETEDACPAAVSQIPDLRIVPVHDELGVGQRGNRLAPAGSDQLELPVAVELVPEQVAEEERTRPDAAHHLGKRRLVDLEEAELRAVGVEEGGGDPGDEVGTRAVVGDPSAQLQDLGRHRGGRRLAVRRRDERRAVFEPRGEPVDRARIELPEELSGQRRAATAAGHARERACRAEHGRLERQRDRGARTRGER